MQHVPYSAFLMGYEHSQSNRRLLVYSPMTNISTEYVRQYSQSTLHPSKVFSKKLAKTKTLLPHLLPLIYTHIACSGQRHSALANFS